MEKKFYTVKEVANLFRAKRSTVTYWARQGRIKGIKIGRAWKFSKEEIKRVAKEGL